jgi:GNAT superfamily N-acetyltransferase
MAEEQITVQLVSNRDLREGIEGRFDDPEGIAGMTPEKTAALLANPLLGADDEPAQVLVQVDGRVAGRTDMIAGEIETPAGAAPCFWLGAVLVSGHFRRRGLGETLIRAAEACREGTAGCGLSRAVRPLYAKLGFVEFAMPRHVLVARSKPLFETRLGRAAGVTAAVVDHVAAAQKELLLLKRRRRSRALTLEDCDAFPLELEARLREHEASFAPHRSAAWLTWVARHSFGDPTYRRRLFLVHGGSEAVGYFVVKARTYTGGVTRWNLDRLDLASLVDWRIFEPDAIHFDELVLLAVEATADWGMDALEVCVPPDSEPARTGRLGFLPAGANHFIVKSDPGSALSADGSRQAHAWLLRPGEGDCVFS